MLPRVSVVQANNADFLLFSTGDHISNTIFRTGEWDPHLVSISKVFYQGEDAPFIIDVGANVGGYSVPIAKDIMRGGGLVWGFEPQRIVYYQLCGNVVLNRLDNYYAFNQAIGEVNGFVQIPEVDHESSQNIGAFSLEKGYRERLGVEHSMRQASNAVPLVTLDSLRVPKVPTLIKLDVEGLEINVINGARHFLEEHHYPAIIFEVWAYEWFEKQRQVLMDTLTQLGYVISQVTVADYVAQNRRNPIAVDFVREDGGRVFMKRVK